MSSHSSTPALPIVAHTAAIATALKEHPIVLLSSPPGTGKTTALPPYLLNTLATTPAKRIAMLEPRRVAAVRAAEFIRENALYPVPPQSVGYRVRGESTTNNNTCLEVQTYGVFNRIAVDSPDLERYSLIIFDEAHERSIDIDLAFAQALEALSVRPDLRILVMSATLNVEDFQKLCPTAPLISVASVQYPVTISYQPPASDHYRDFPQHVTKAIHSVTHQSGDILVFLPGKGEIARVTDELERFQVAREIIPLHGELPLAEQRRVLSPLPSAIPRIILSTAIAETSVTVPRVHTVVDAGLARVPRFDPERSLPSLVTNRVSAATAEQRAGRAGRLGPGTCVRLWPAHEALVRFRSPEIVESDLAPLILNLAASGITDYRSLRWITEPRAGAVVAATELLQKLGALDSSGRCTPYGRALQRIPAHPRLAQIVLTAARANQLDLGAAIAAALSERKPGIGKPAGFVEDLQQLLTQKPSHSERAVAEDFIRAASNNKTDHRAEVDARIDGALDIATLVAAGFPDRIAYRVGEREYLLSGGPKAALPEQSSFSRSPWLIVSQIRARPNAATHTITQAASLPPPETLNQVFPNLLEQVDSLEWNPSRAAVVRRTGKRIGAIEFGTHDEAADPSEAATGILLEQLRLGDLPISTGWRSLLRRIVWLAHDEALKSELPNGLPDWFANFAKELTADLKSERLLSSYPAALAAFEPYLSGITRVRDCSVEAVGVALESLCGGRSALKQISAAVPDNFTLPRGRTVEIDYESGKKPTIRSRLQDFFGTSTTHPTIANGKVRLLCELLSPAKRPVQITDDLPRFWSGSYAEVRKEMKNRYPKHDWPEKP